MITPGGAEKLMMSFLKIYPNAEIYTSIFIKENFWPISTTIHESIKLPKLFKKFFKFRPISIFISSVLSVLSPIYIETTNVKEYDLVISLSARVSKGVITTPDTIFIDYVQTPTRFEWDNEQSPRAFRMKFLNKLLSPFISTAYRIWDYTASKRSDYKVSISEYIQKKVEKFYRQNSVVIYPGIDNYYYTELSDKDIDKAENEIKRVIKTDIYNKSFYLVVSRLYDYKRVDWAVQACNESKVNLIVVGDGPDKKYLMKQAEKELNKSIFFTGRISDISVKYLYSKAEGFIFAGIEDFGMVPVEAMAQGCPVLAFNEGGGVETIIDSVTGVLFNSLQDLIDRLSNYQKSDYNSEQIRDRAKKFHEEKFKKEWTEYVEKIIYETKRKKR